MVNENQDYQKMLTEMNARVLNVNAATKGPKMQSPSSASEAKRIQTRILNSSRKISKTEPVSSKKKKIQG